MSTFLAIAERARLAFNSYETDAEGRVELVEGKLQVTSVTSTPWVTVKSRGDVDQTKELLTKAESNCLIPHSVKTHVTMHATVESV